jgi:putative DNA primase/helicase
MSEKMENTLGVAAPEDERLNEFSTLLVTNKADANENLSLSDANQLYNELVQDSEDLESKNFRALWFDRVGILKEKGFESLYKDLIRKAHEFDEERRKTDKEVRAQEVELNAAIKEHGNQKLSEMSFFEFVKATGGFKKYCDGDKAKTSGKPRIEHYTLAQDLIRCYHFITLADSEEILVYADGIYKHGGEVIIKKAIEVLFGPIASGYDVNEVIGHVQRATYVDRDELNADKSILNLKNGLFNTTTRELKPHTPEFYSTVRLPLCYDLDAEAVRFKEFLEQVVDSADIPVIEEAFGYCLYRGYPFHKGFLFVGAGSNGKSTLLSVLERFLGKENTTNVLIHAIESNRFAAYKLFGKLAVINADLPDKTLKSTGTFKSITGEDTIDAEIKFKAGIVFKNFAKVFISANKVPVTYDTTFAFFSRWVIVNFPNQFVQAFPQMLIEDEGDAKKTNPHLLKRILKNPPKHRINTQKYIKDGREMGVNQNPLKELSTEEELSGILNIALVGLERLLNNGMFTYTKSIEETREAYLTLSDPLYGFIKECCLLDPEAGTTKSDFYLKYVQYCKANGRVPSTSNMVGRILPTIITVSDFTPRFGNVREKAWRGIRIIHESDKDVVTEVTEVTENSTPKRDKRDVK